MKNTVINQLSTNYNSQSSKSPEDVNMMIATWSEVGAITNRRQPWKNHRWWLGQCWSLCRWRLPLNDRWSVACISRSFTKYQWIIISVVLNQIMKCPLIDLHPMVQSYSHHDYVSNKIASLEFHRCIIKINQKKTENSWKVGAFGNDSPYNSNHVSDITTWGHYNSATCLPSGNSWHSYGK